jgi:hypothetical protein
MKHSSVLLAFTVIVIASLACQTLTGGGGGNPTAAPGDHNSNDSESPTVVAPTESSTTDQPISIDFLMTEDAYNITEVSGSLIFYTKLSLEDTMQFYRDEYTARGYTEREILTVVSDGTFSMVFDGDPGGKAVVIQSVDLGDGSRTVAIRLEDV